MTTVVAAIVEREGKILACQRRAGGPHPLKWEFPGGKVEPGEERIGALERELREELGIEARVGEEVARYQYSYPGKNPILLVFFSVDEYSGTLENRVFERVLWVDRHDLEAYDFLEGDAEIVRLLTSKGSRY